MSTESEGVIQFALEFKHSEAPPWTLCKELDGWRTVLFELGLIGKDPKRYDGLAYGNVSRRLDGQRFLISGSQTGGLPRLGAREYCWVDVCDLATNHVLAHGPLPPSSEALTHGAAFQASDRIQSVLHVHSPLIWQSAGALSLPATPADVPYGTIEMANEVFRKIGTNPRIVLVMGGHQDGIIATGDSPEAAALILLRTWMDAAQQMRD